MFKCSDLFATIVVLTWHVSNDLDKVHVHEVTLVIVFRKNVSSTGQMTMNHYAMGT